MGYSFIFSRWKSCSKEYCRPFPPFWDNFVTDSQEEQSGRHNKLYSLVVMHPVKPINDPYNGCDGKEVLEHYPVKDKKIFFGCQFYNDWKFGQWACTNQQWESIPGSILIAGSQAYKNSKLWFYTVTCKFLCYLEKDLPVDQFNRKKMRQKTDTALTYVRNILPGFFYANISMPIASSLCSQ